MSMEDPFSTDNPQKRIVNIMSLFFSLLALFCSVMTIVLIKKMGHWNPQVALIWWMSLCQCSYDASFFGYLSQSKNKILYEASSFFQLFGGVSVTLFTNVITAVLMYVILTRKNFDVFRYFHIVLTFTLGPALFVGILYLVKADDHEYLKSTVSPMYYWLRLGSIFLNVIFYFVTSYTVRRITSQREHRTRTENAILVLTSRSKYYWIVQAISRSGAAIYEQVYGYDGYKGFSSTNQFSAAMSFAVLNPSASIGYLAIFLAMQPGAVDNFKELLMVDVFRTLSCGLSRGFTSFEIPTGNKVKADDTAKIQQAKEKQQQQQQQQQQESRSRTGSDAHMLEASSRGTEASGGSMCTDTSSLNSARSTGTSRRTTETIDFRMSEENENNDNSENPTEEDTDVENRGASPKKTGAESGTGTASRAAVVGTLAGGLAAKGSLPTSKANMSSNAEASDTSWTSMLSRSLASETMANLTGPTQTQLQTTTERSSSSLNVGGSISSKSGNLSGMSGLSGASGGLGGMRRNLGSSNFADLCVDDLEDDQLFEIIQMPEDVTASDDAYNDMMASSWQEGAMSFSPPPAGSIDNPLNIDKM